MDTTVLLVLAYGQTTGVRNILFLSALCGCR